MQRERAERDAEIYSSQVRDLMTAVVDAIKRQAEELDQHPRIMNKAAIMPRGAEITIRRASTIDIPDRRIELHFRPDLRLVSWAYEMSANPVYSEYTVVDDGEYGFEVTGETLRLDGFEIENDRLTQILFIVYN